MKRSLRALSTLFILPISLAIQSGPDTAEAAPRPNLVPEIHVMADVVQAGDTVPVITVVTNKALGPAYGAGYNLLLPEGVAYTILSAGNCSADRVGTQTMFICMDDLPPAGKSILALDITFPAAGSYLFSSTVDASNMIHEVRENDNTAVLTVEVQ